MTFPYLPVETLHTIGTGIGAVLLGGILRVCRSSLDQLKGPKDNNGQHGPCVRDLLLKVMVTVEDHTNLSERRHQERVVVFDSMKEDIQNMRSQLNRLELRVGETESALVELKKPIEKIIVDKL